MLLCRIAVVFSATLCLLLCRVAVVFSATLCLLLCRVAVVFSATLCLLLCRVAGAAVLRPHSGGVGRKGVDGVVPSRPRLQPRQSGHQVPLRGPLALLPRRTAPVPAVRHGLTKTASWR